MNQSPSQLPREIQPGRLATSTTTNELVRALRAMAPPSLAGVDGEAMSFSTVVICKVVSPLSGATANNLAGFYAAKLVTILPTSSKPAASIKEAGLGIVAKVANVRLLNPAEIAGAGGTSLGKDSYVAALLVGSVDTSGWMLAIAIPPSPAFFPVLVKWVAGSDGSSSTYASWTYDLYQISDTTYTSKLNTAGTLQPRCGRSRGIKSAVTKAADGTIASAYIDKDGAIQLFDCIEFTNTTACT